MLDGHSCTGGVGYINVRLAAAKDDSAVGELRRVVNHVSGFDALDRRRGGLAARHLALVSRTFLHHGFARGWEVEAGLSLYGRKRRRGTGDLLEQATGKEMRGGEGRLLDSLTLDQPASPRGPGEEATLTIFEFFLCGGKEYFKRGRCD